MNSICSFCGRATEGIQSLNCGYHSICSLCSRSRGIYYECLLCASRDRRTIERVRISHFANMQISKGGSSYVDSWKEKDKSDYSPMFHTEQSAQRAKPINTYMSISSQHNYGIPPVNYKSLPVYQGGQSYVTSEPSTVYPYATPVDIQREIEYSFIPLKGEAVEDSCVSDLRHQTKLAIPVNSRNRGSQLDSALPIYSYQPQYTEKAIPCTINKPPHKVTYTQEKAWEEPRYPVNPNPAVAGNMAYSLNRSDPNVRIWNEM